MSEILQNPEVLQQQETNKQQIEAVYGTLDGFGDFQILLQSLDISLQKEIESLLIALKNNPDFKNELDWMTGGAFPTKASEVRYLLEKYPNTDNKTLAQIETEEAETQTIDTTIKTEQAETKTIDTTIKTEQAETQTEQAETQTEQAETQTEKQKIIETLQSIRIPGVDIFSDLQAAGIDINSDFDAAKFNEFCQNNVGKYLEKAQEYSPQTFVQTYESFAQISASETVTLPALDAILEQYNTEYQTTKLALENPKVSFPRDTDAVQVALGDSSISKIEGDRIYGENGEVIDVSGDTPTLSLEGQDGMTLEIGNIETPDMRKGEKEISGLETAIGGLKEKIARNEKILETYVLGVDASFVSNEAQTDSYFTALLQVGVDRKFIETLDEQDIFGTALLNALGDYIESQNTDYKSDIAKFEQQVGILKSRMETQNVLASEKIRIQKERVEASAKFLERMGVSKAISRLKEIFALISPATPLSLPNGNIVTRINLSTMELEGSFSPSLGEAGAKDPNTQKILSQMLNMALFGTPDEPIQIAAGGNIFFAQIGDNKKISEVQDTGVFQRKIDAIVGDPAFGVQVRKNLWGKV